MIPTDKKLPTEEKRERCQTQEPHLPTGTVKLSYTLQKKETDIQKAEEEKEMYILYMIVSWYINKQQYVACYRMLWKMKWIWVSHLKRKKTRLLFTGNLILIVAPDPGWPTGKPMSETLSWDRFKEGIPQKNKCLLSVMDASVCVCRDEIPF